MSQEQAPSCGSSSPRFGCWTCTVVQKDRSLRGLIDSGHAEAERMEALFDFREWLIALRRTTIIAFPFEETATRSNATTDPVFTDLSSWESASRYSTSYVRSNDESVNHLSFRKKSIASKMFGGATKYGRMPDRHSTGASS